MKTIHMMLQGKGGIGKSVCACFLAQYLADSGQEAELIDGDEVSKSLQSFRSLSVRKHAILKDGEIDVDQLDELWRAFFKTEQTLVVDTGSAASFTGFVKALVEGSIPETTVETGRRFVIHSVVTGGPTRDGTIIGLADLLALFPTTPFVVWVNPFWGPCEAKGKSFEQMGIYEKHKDQIAGVVKLPDLPSNFSGKEVVKMLGAHQTFSDILDNPEVDLLTRNRLQKAKRAIFEAISVGVV